MSPNSDDGRDLLTRLRELRDAASGRERVTLTNAVSVLEIHAAECQPPADRPERQELEALKELRDIIAANALNRRDLEGDFGASHEFDVLWKCYHAVWGALVRATAMLQKAHNQTPLCWVRPGDVEFLNQGEPDVSDPAEVELSPMEDASEGQTMPLYARPGLMVPPPADAERELRDGWPCAKCMNAADQENPADNEPPRKSRRCDTPGCILQAPPADAEREPYWVDVRELSFLLRENYLSRERTERHRTPLYTARPTSGE